MRGLTMMAIRAVLIFAIVSGSVFAESIDVDIARGLEKAAKGELQERGLLQRLERGFATSGDVTKQIQIANVLTYAPASSGLKDRYVDFLLAQPKASQVLGKKEVYRLHRLRADRAFDLGKFAAARSDYEALMGVSDPLVREYAVLKAGWCYMNDDKPQLAWTLWIEQAEKERKTLPTNLAHSLGQALMENPQRTREDFDRLGNLRLDTASLQNILNGMEQGADVLDTAAKMRSAVANAEALPWSESLANRLLEQMGGTGSRACLFVPWVTLVKNGREVAPLSYNVVENCTVWLSTGTNTGTKMAPADATNSRKAQRPVKPTGKEVEIVQRATELLKQWIPQQRWGKSQLRVPFGFYALSGDVMKACETGLGWLSEPGNPEHRGRAPVPEITDSCRRAAADPAHSETIAKYFDPNSGNIPYLSNSKDPLLFVALALADVPAFEKIILNALNSQAAKYENTLLPVLSLEKLEAAKQYEASEALWATMVKKQADDPAASSTWRQILKRRLKKLTDAKASPEEVRQLLDRTLLAPGDPALSEFGYSLWLQYLALEVALARKNPLEAEKTLLANGAASGVAHSLLTKPRVKAFPKLGAPTVEMMAWFSMWPALWDTVSGPDGMPFTMVRSEALEVRLLSALVRGEVTPAAGVEQKDPSLRFITELGLKLKEAPGGDWMEGIKPTGNSVVARDAMYLQSLAKRQKNLLVQTKNSKAAAKQALDWITFLDQKKREIGKRTWCHELFFSAAQDSIAGFCEKATERMPSLKQAVQGAGSTEAQWKDFFAAFEKKLEQCRSKSETRRASL